MFKVGDSVQRIVSSHGYAIKGKIYTVSKVHDDNKHISIAEDNLGVGYSIDRFILVPNNKSFKELTDNLNKLIG